MRRKGKGRKSSINRIRLEFKDEFGEWTGEISYPVLIESDWNLK